MCALRSLGGIRVDEFAALLPCPLDEGVGLAERVRELSKELRDCGRVGSGRYQTVSICVAVGPLQPNSMVLLAGRLTPRSIRPIERRPQIGSRPRQSCALSLECGRKNRGGKTAVRLQKPQPA